MSIRPKISIIVPVYNAEANLHRCIDSILKQSFTDFELILVNDGSKDMSADICNRYSQKDVRVRVYHKENGGVGSARNLGLNNILGEWVTFVDADDQMEETGLESLIEGTTADLVVSGFKHINVCNNTFCDDLPPQTGQIDISNKGKLIDSLLWRLYFTTPWGKLFNAFIIQNKNIRFSSALRLGEDTDFVFRYLLEISTIFLIKKTTYSYFDEGNQYKKYALSASEYKNLSECFSFDIDSIQKKIGYMLSQTNSIIQDYYADLFLCYLKQQKTYLSFSCALKALNAKGDSCIIGKSRKRLLRLLLMYCPWIAYTYFKIRNSKG